jgi:hypothetical protein
MDFVHAMDELQPGKYAHCPSQKPTEIPPNTWLVPETRLLLGEALIEHRFVIV